jgi:hypothetical protein
MYHGHSILQSYKKTLVGRAAFLRQKTWTAPVSLGTAEKLADYRMRGCEETADLQIGGR